MHKTTAVMRPLRQMGEWRVRYGYAVLVSFTLSALLVVLTGASYWISRRTAVASARDRVHGEAIRAAAVIEGELTRLPAVVRAVADDFAAGRVTGATLPARLERAIETTPQLSGIGAAFIPNAFDPELRLYAPYAQRSETGSELIQLDSQYDYTEGHDWYSTPLKQGAAWSEPQLTGSGVAPAVEYSVPLLSPPSAGGSASPVGVIHGTMSLSEIDGLIRSLDLGEYGYGFLISKTGFVISHPFADEYAASRPLPAAVGQSGAGSTDRGIFESTRTGARSVVEDAVDPVTGEPSWIFVEPVPSTGWSVGVVFFTGETASDAGIRRKLIRFTLALFLLAALILAIVIPRLYQGRVKVLWIGMVAASALLVAVMGALWAEGYGVRSPALAEDRVFANTAAIQKFTLDMTRAALSRGSHLPIFIPTGVFVQTLEIIGPNAVAFTGYIWQTYPRTLPQSVARGFVLPEASDRQVTEAYRQSDSENETIGWFVRATIRQTFDYRKYPLDQQVVRFSIWHQSLDGRVIPIPDLESYRIIHPLARFGLEKDFTLPGWVVERTQFTHRNRSHNTSFGIGRNGADSIGELSFNIVLNRRIIEPIFSNLLPLAVSGFMVFALLLVVKESTRSNVVQILAAYSALFFVVILSELDLRRKLSSSSILYIEYFYFVMYGAILAVALITLTNAWTGLFPRIEKREHLLPKLLFWPCLLSALLVITIAVFY